MKHPAVTNSRKKSQSLLTLLASLVLLNLLSNTPTAFDSLVLAQSPSAIPQYSDWSAPVNLGPILILQVERHRYRSHTRA